MTWSVVAMLSAASAAAFAVPARPWLVSPRRRSSAPLIPVVALVSMSTLSSPHLAGGVLVAVGAAAAVRILLVRRRRRRAALSGQARVLAFCQLIGSELAAGQPPGLALQRAAEEWPDLGPLSTAFALGADVPAAMRAASAAPGQADLTFVAAAWQVAHHSGGGLSAAMTRVASGLRATQATRRVVAAELASARATARLMAGLPVFALMMGRGIGADPVAFLLGTTPGLVCLAVGLALGFAGVAWIEAIADGVS
ncbi:Type II secretion system protein [metagenome]|uniref:Type II secretion system protein n=1 Tax=metagenome TaxID=256318 RepID=A0A2P2CEY6_9ZZZZ